jgi:MFS family permease
MPYRLVTILFACYLVAFIDRGLIAVAAAPIRHDLALSDTQLGLLIGPAFVTFFCLCAIPLGWLADRMSRRALIAAALLFWSIMTGCCALAGSFWSLFAARLGVGLGEFASLDKSGPPPAMPDWSPVRSFGGYGAWAAQGSPGQSGAARVMHSCASHSALQSHPGKVALSALWGSLGCSCWAF